MLTPYFPAMILPLFAIIDPLLSRFAPAFKPVIVGLAAVVGMAICAALTPLTLVEVPAQVVILFGLLTAGYTAGKVVEGKIPGVTTAVVLFAISCLGVAGMAFAQDTGLPAEGAGTGAWASWGFALVYGIIARLLAKKRKEK